MLPAVLTGRALGMCFESPIEMIRIAEAGRGGNQVHGPIRFSQDVAAVVVPERFRDAVTLPQHFMQNVVINYLSSI